MSLVEAFLLMLSFSLFFLWIWLLLSVFAGVFRSEDLSGVANAAWVVLLVVLPYLGVLVYLTAHGGGMHDRAVARAEAAQTAASCPRTSSRPRRPSCSREPLRERRGGGGRTARFLVVPVGSVRWPGPISNGGVPCRPRSPSDRADGSPWTGI